MPTCAFSGVVGVRNCIRRRRRRSILSLIQSGRCDAQAKPPFSLRRWNRDLKFRKRSAEHGKRRNSVPLFLLFLSAEHTKAKKKTMANAVGNRNQFCIERCTHTHGQQVNGGAWPSAARSFAVPRPVPLWPANYINRLLISYLPQGRSKRPTIGAIAFSRLKSIQSEIAKLIKRAKIAAARSAAAEIRENRRLMCPSNGNRRSGDFTSSRDRQPNNFRTRMLSFRFVFAIIAAFRSLLTVNIRADFGSPFCFSHCLSNADACRGRSPDVTLVASARVVQRQQRVSCSELGIFIAAPKSAYDIHFCFSLALSQILRAGERANGKRNRERRRLQLN